MRGSVAPNPCLGPRCVASLNARCGWFLGWLSTRGHGCVPFFYGLHKARGKMRGITQSASMGLGSLDLSPYPAPSLLSAAKRLPGRGGWVF